MSDAPAAPADPVVPPGRPGIGQLIVTVMSPLLLVLMLVALIFIQIPPENRDMFNIALGAVLGWNTAVVGCHTQENFEWGWQVNRVVATANGEERQATSRS